MRRPAALPTIEELEEQVALMQAEIDGADCSPCRRRKLGPKIAAAQRRIIQMRRDAALDRARQ